ncbi:MAG: hypothetical protein FJX75_11585 [Armatimonadetes bacterium]|nr:hypothetical protein [Armatimonadota bacterium]
MIVFSENRRHLGVLDFAGAGREDFDAWVEWSSRWGGRQQRAHDIEAGHGNGGKAFMVRGCRTSAFVCGHRDGRRTQMGFTNDDPELRYVAGFFEDEAGQAIDGLSDPMPEEALNALLRPLGSGVGALPAPAREVLRQRRAYTLVVLRDVNDLMPAGTRAEAMRSAVDDLRGHAQAALTLESSTVWVLRGKDVVGGPLTIEPLPPKTGFGTPWRFEVPESLADPSSGRMVAIPSHPEGRGHLEISFTEQHLRMSDRRKALNVVRVRNRRNIIANWSVADLAPVGSSAFLYGTLMCPVLGPEHLVGADRQSLAPVPMVLALQHWTAEHLQKAAEAVQKAEQESESKTDREKASSALRKLRELMREFLRQETAGAGTGGTKGGGTGERVREFGDRVDEIALEDGSSAISVPVGARVPLRWTCWQLDNERKRLPVRSPAVALGCDPPGAVQWDPSGVICALKPGTATIWLTTRPDALESNKVRLHGWHVTSVELRPPRDGLRQGERVQVRIVGRTGQGAAISDALYETSIDEAGMGRFGRGGVFTAGGTPGIATLRVRFGRGETDHTTCCVRITEERVERQRKGGGPDVPYILLCGEEAPGRNDLSPEQRTHRGGPEYPTIIDWEPEWQRDPEVVWINQYSKESALVRRGRGPSGVTGIGSPTFRNYLVLKCFDVLRRLWVRQELGHQMGIGYDEFIRRLSDAEMQTASFLDAGFSVVSGLSRGRQVKEG